MHLLRRVGLRVGAGGLVAPVRGALRRRALRAAAPALLLAPFSLPLALTLALALVVFALSRWIRRARLREAGEIAALVGVGLALLATLPGEGLALAAARAVLHMLALLAALPASLIALASVPAWRVPAVGATPDMPGVARLRLRDLPDAVVLVRRCFAQPPLGWGEVAVWLARGAGWGVFDAWGDLAGLVIAFPLAGGLSWIELLAVHPRARRGGVGRRLAAAVGPAMLAVREGNGGAQAFYARAGFAVVTRWRGYYAGGEAALVLRRG